MSWYGGHAIEERARAMFLEDMDHRDGVIVYYTAELRELYETLAEAAGPYNRALVNAAEATYELRCMLDTGEDINTELTRRLVLYAVGGVLFNVSNFPKEAQSHLLGRDMTPLRTKITDAVLAALGIKEEA